MISIFIGIAVSFIFIYLHRTQLTTFRTKFDTLFYRQRQAGGSFNSQAGQQAKKLKEKLEIEKLLSRFPCKSEKFSHFRHPQAAKAKAKLANHSFVQLKRKKRRLHNQ